MRSTSGRRSAGLLPRCRDRLRDLDRGSQVVLDQGGEPRGVLLGDLDAPRHMIAFPVIGWTQFKGCLNSRTYAELAAIGACLSLHEPWRAAAGRVWPNRIGRRLASRGGLR